MSTFSFWHLLLIDSNAREDVDSRNTINSIHKLTDNSNYAGKS